MPFSRKQSGSWVAAVPRRRSGAGWVVARVRRRVGGSWQQVWPLALVGSSNGLVAGGASLSPITRNNTISVTGGYGPYTYSTIKTGGAAQMALSNASTANPTVSSTGASGGTVRDATFSTTVTDSFGTTHTYEWGASFEWY